MTVAEALLAFRTGKLTPVALMEAYLARIAKYESIYLAYNDMPEPAEVIAKAQALGRRPGHKALLWGTAQAPKDNYYTKDLLTTGNSPIFIDFQPTFDSTCVARLRSNGGIVIGKAQMGPLAGGRALLPGTNIPTTRNAWTPDDIRYSPSGSSGGTGTAVAGRLATSGLGTQTGGSITSPGQAQGLTAFKPTFGRTSLYGVIPLTYTRDHTGPLARDAKDAAIMLQALAGADINDPRTVGLPPVPDYITAATPVVRRRKVELRWKTKIGILPGWSTPTDAQQAALRAQLVTVLQGIPGCTVADVTLPTDWDVLQEISSTTGEGSNWFVPYLRQDVRLFATRLTGFMGGVTRSASTYLKAMMARYELFERTQAQLFTQCDLVLVPSVGQFDLIGHPVSSFMIGFGTDDHDGAHGAPRRPARRSPVRRGAHPVGHLRLPVAHRLAHPPAAGPDGGRTGAGTSAAARSAMGLMAATEATLAAVPAWPGQAPDLVYTIDPAAQPPDES